MLSFLIRDVFFFCFPELSGHNGLVLVPRACFTGDPPAAKAPPHLSLIKLSRSTRSFPFDVSDISVFAQQESHTTNPYRTYRG